MARKNGAPASTNNQPAAASKTAAPKKAAAPKKKAAAKKPAKKAGVASSVQVGKAPPSAPTAGKPTTIVANQHTAPIIFPRRNGALLLTPLVIPPGTAVPVDTEEWNKRKENVLVQHYIDHHLLAEVNSVGPVPVLSSSSVELPIPEHLQDNKDEKQGSVTASGVTKAEPGTVEV